MRRVLGTLATVWTIAATACGAPADDGVLAISCAGVGTQFELCRQGVEAWSASTGHAARLVSAPNSSTERLALYQQLLAARAGDIDVFQIDVVWPGILGPHFVDLRDFVPEAEIDGHFPAIIANNTVDGRLVAMPWFTDTGLLYYRSDLLERYGEAVPETWDQLRAAAERIQRAERRSGNDRMWGFVWQGRAYEGLTCNALEWIASHGGGRIVDDEGRVTVANPRAERALTVAASWVGVISPRGVLNYAEEEARGVFQSGDAVFMRNWPYAWALANGGDSPVAGLVGVAALPRGAEGRHVGTLGGWQLAVSRYSTQPERAVDLVRWLTRRDEQERRAITGALLPTIEALYRDPDVLAAQPFFGELAPLFREAIARPSAITGIRYNQVSSAFWTAVHATLVGDGSAAANLAELEERLTLLSRGGGW